MYVCMYVRSNRIHRSPVYQKYDFTRLPAYTRDSASQILSIRNFRIVRIVSRSLLSTGHFYVRRDSEATSHARVDTGAVRSRQTGREMKDRHSTGEMRAPHVNTKKRRARLWIIAGSARLTDTTARARARRKYSRHTQLHFTRNFSAPEYSLVLDRTRADRRGAVVYLARMCREFTSLAQGFDVAIFASAAREIFLLSPLSLRTFPVKIATFRRAGTARALRFTFGHLKTIFENDYKKNRARYLHKCGRTERKRERERVGKIKRIRNEICLSCRRTDAIRY